MPDTSLNLTRMSRFLEVLTKETTGVTMTTEMVQILLELYSYKEMSQQSLMRTIGTAKTTHSRHLAKLSVGENPLARNGPGWVESYEDAVDRRTKLVRLTPRGRALIDRVTEAVH